MVLEETPVLNCVRNCFDESYLGRIAITRIYIGQNYYCNYACFRALYSCILYWYSWSMRLVYF